MDVPNLLLCLPGGSEIELPWDDNTTCYTTPSNNYEVCTVLGGPSGLDIVGWEVYELGVSMGTIPGDADNPPVGDFGNGFIAKGDVPDSGSDAGSDPGGSDPAGSDPAGSEKNSAIVPARFSPTGYAALFVVESPEVRFEDTVVVPVGGVETRLPVDYRFVEVCAPGSVQVVGYAADKAVRVQVTLEVELGAAYLVVRCSVWPWRRPRRVTVRLSGLRRKFEQVRFPAKTKEQFEANEIFIKNFYEGGES